MDDPFHVNHLDDEREHVVDQGANCWCNPTVLEDGMLIVHNAADCRELIEQAEEIKWAVSDRLTEDSSEVE